MKFRLKIIWNPCILGLFRLKILAPQQVTKSFLTLFTPRIRGAKCTSPWAKTIVTPRNIGLPDLTHPIFKLPSFENWYWYSNITDNNRALFWLKISIHKRVTKSIFLTIWGHSRFYWTKKILTLRNSSYHNPHYGVGFFNLIYFYYFFWGVIHDSTRKFEYKIRVLYAFTKLMYIIIIIIYKHIKIPIQQVVIWWRFLTGSGVIQEKWNFLMELLENP